MESDFFLLINFCRFILNAGINPPKLSSIMKWPYSLQHKTTAAVILLLIIGLIGINNFKEYQVAKQMNSTIHTMYKDRLWAEHLISEIQYSVSQLKNCSQSIDVHPQLNRIANLNAQFAQTTLTQNEFSIFSDYQLLCKNIYSTASFSSISESDFQKAEKYLQALNLTQISEGKILLTEMDNMHKSANLLAKFEITLLIVLGIIIQILVFTSKTLKKAFKPSAPQWN